MRNSSSHRICTDSEEDIRWLEEFLIPWFGAGEEPPDIEFRVTHDARRYQQLLDGGTGPSTARVFTMDAESIDYPVRQEPGGRLVVFDEKHGLFHLVDGNRVELIVRDGTAGARLQVMRVVRELAMGVAQLTGGRFLHASAFVADGRAAIITGPRRSGKTSLLSYVLANSSAGFLCNDRLLVRQSGPSVSLRGMPTVISMREGTIDLFPGMRQTIVDLGYSSGFTLDESRNRGRLVAFPKRPGRHGLSPRQFCSLLGCQPVRTAFGAVLLFPRQTGVDGGIRLHRLQPEAARKRLQNSFFGAIGPDKLSDVFTFIPKNSTGQRAPDDRAVCDRLASSMAAFDCELGNQAYEGDSGSSLLLDLVLSNPGQSAVDVTAASIQK